jgi:hypothetical protein
VSPPTETWDIVDRGSTTTAREAASNMLLCEAALVQIENRPLGGVASAG